MKRPRRPKLKRPSLRRPGFGRGAGKPKKAAAKPAKPPAKAAKDAAKPAAKPADKPAAKAAAKPAAKPGAKAAEKAKPAGKAKAEAKKAPEKGQPADDLWFRASTRVRALGYGGREKAQQAGRGLRKAGRASADIWAKRSREERIGFAGVVGVLLLVALLRFVPVPGVPCQISAVKECAPADEAVALVPADALLYAHMTLDRDSTQYERAADAFDELPDLREAFAAEVRASISPPSGTPVDVEADILPWADQDLSVAQLPAAPKSTPTSVFIIGVDDREGAEQFLAKVAPPGEPEEAKEGDATLEVYPSGFAAAFVEDSLAFGNEAAVRATLKAGAGGEPALEDSGEGTPRDDLPDARFAEVYVSRAGVQTFLAGRLGPASQLETFVNYAATSGFAAAAVAREDGIEIEMVSEQDPELVKKSPSFFSALPTFEPNLTAELGTRAIGYVGVGEMGSTLAELLGRAGGESGGLAGSLQGLAAQLEAEAGVNPLSDLLPALKGQAALVAEPTDGLPFASLIVDGVDEDKANEALAGLQKPLLAALTPGGGQAASFEESEVEGVTVRSVQASPTIQLSYAVFDGKLVISTDPDGIAQVRAGGEKLADSSTYEKATDQLPERVSALVFLNLEEFFDQVEGIGFAEDTDFAQLALQFENAASLGLAVRGDDTKIRSELFLAVD